MSESQVQDRPVTAPADDTTEIPIQTPSTSLLGKIEAASKIVAFAAAAIGAIGALLQYHLNSEAEARMRDLAVLETDLKVSHLFGELVQTANGYGKWSAPNDKIIQTTLEHIPPAVFEELLRKDTIALHYLFRASIIPEPVPLSAEVAAAESIANLAMKYPILREPAIEGLKVVKSFLPSASRPLDRLCRSNGLASECDLPETKQPEKSPSE
jgi:hypothetical protein